MKTSLIFNKIDNYASTIHRGRAGMGSLTEAPAPKRTAASALSRAAAGNERMERLRKFQEERARKRAEARAKAPKAPFYVGVYKVGSLFCYFVHESLSTTS